MPLTFHLTQAAYTTSVRFLLWGLIIWGEYHLRDGWKSTRRHIPGRLFLVYKIHSCKGPPPGENDTLYLHWQRQTLQPTLFQQEDLNITKLPSHIFLLSSCLGKCLSSNVVPARPSTSRSQHWCDSYWHTHQCSNPEVYSTICLQWATSNLEVFHVA